MTSLALLAAAVAALRPPASPAEIVVLEADEQVAVYAGDDAWVVSPTATARRVAARLGAGLDVLVVFSAFPTTVDGGAVYHAVANDVLGLNLDADGRNPERFDHSAEYGLPGLQGVVLVGSARELPDDDDEPFLGAPSAAALLAHELGHRYGPRVCFSDSEDGRPRADLLAEDLGHWSCLLDTGGGPLGGSRWLADGDGGFVSGEPSGAYGPLDLYLLGLLPPGDVPPVLLLSDVHPREPGPEPCGRPGEPAAPGVRVEATPEWVELAEVVAVEGPRDPAWDEAPHAWRQAFVLLEWPGEPNAALTTRLAGLRAAWARHFLASTDGRGRVLTTLDGRDDLPDFRFTAGADGWRAVGAGRPPPVARAGALVIPHSAVVHDDLILEAEVDDVAELRLPPGTADTGWTLSFRPEGGEWQPGVAPSAGGEPGTLVIPLGAQPAWRGRVDALRLHPPEAGATELRVDSLLVRSRRPEDPPAAAAPRPEAGCDCTLPRPATPWPWRHLRRRS